MVLTFPIFWAIILQFGLSSADHVGCCYPIHPQQELCEAQFVAEVYLHYKMGQSAEPFQPYSAEIMQIFKSGSNLGKGRKSWKRRIGTKMNNAILYAPGRNHTCGEVMVNAGDRYLFEGYIEYLPPANSPNPLIMVAYVCRSMTNVKDVTNMKARMIKHMVEQDGCTCTLSELPSKDRCSLPYSGSCRFTNGMCVRNKRGACQWQIIQPCEQT